MGKDTVWHRNARRVNHFHNPSSLSRIAWANGFIYRDLDFRDRYISQPYIRLAGQSVGFIL